MQAKSSVVSMIVVSALILVMGAMTAGLAGGVHSAEGRASRHPETAGDSGSMVAGMNDFDYFPSHYVNQATKIEELPAQS